MTKIKAGQIWEDVVRGGTMEIIEVKRSDAGNEHVCFKIIDEPCVPYEVGQVVEGWQPDQFRRDHRLLPKKVVKRSSSTEMAFNRGVALRNIRLLVAAASLSNVQSTLSTIDDTAVWALGNDTAE